MLQGQRWGLLAGWQTNPSGGSPTSLVFNRHKQQWRDSQGSSWNPHPENQAGGRLLVFHHLNALFRMPLGEDTCDLGFPGGASGKESTYQWRRQKRCGFDPCVRKIPWRRTWQPTPVFLPGESHGQKSLVGCGPQCHKESDTTEATEHARKCTCVI